MPQLAVTQIGGFIPAVDERRVPGAHIIDGQNFFLDVNGPLSGFSRELLKAELFNQTCCDGIQSFAVNEGSRIFYTLRSGIVEWDSDNRTIVVRYQIDPILQTIAPWTFAVCGGKEYFARRGFGVIERDPETDVWERPWPNATDVIAVTQSAGRLVFLTGSVVGWSAIDNGRDIATSLATGAGAQSLAPLSIESAEQAYSVYEYSFGFIVYTARGLMRFEQLDATIPFRFRVISREHFPINEWCVLTLRDYQHVFLDVRGFFATTGDVPEVWQPLMSEAFHREILPQFDLNEPTIVRLLTNTTKTWLFVGLARSSVAVLYTDSAALYMPSNEWGRLNRPHKGIVDIQFRDRDEISTGFIDSNGSFWWFSNTTSDKVAPTVRAPFSIDWSAPVEWPPLRKSTTAALFTGIAKLVAYDATVFDKAGYWNTRAVKEGVLSPNVPPLFREIAATPYVPGDVSGAADIPLWDSGILWDDFVWDGEVVPEPGIPALFSALANMGVLFNQTRVAPQELALAPLNAWVDIGTFRGGEQMDADELSFTHEVGIGGLDRGVGDIFIDWIADFADGDLFEDWLTVPEGTADEDWGFGTASQTNYKIRMRGTLDGYNTWEGQEQRGLVTVENGAYRLHSCYVTGLYHVLRVEALAVNETFHIRTIDFGIEPAGRLT